MSLTGRRQAARRSVVGGSASSFDVGSETVSIDGVVAAQAFSEGSVVTLSGQNRLTVGNYYRVFISLPCILKLGAGVSMRFQPLTREIDFMQEEGGAIVQAVATSRSSMEIVQVNTTRGVTT